MEQHSSKSNSGGSVWTDGDLARDPHQDRDKAAKVRMMFASIAGSYDLNNRVHSFGRDQAWRRFAVKAAGVKPGERVLDVACGTGDLTEAFARTTAASVIGVDFTPAMLDIARKKAPRDLTPAQAAKVEYREGDATALEFDDVTFDVVSIAFGIRNVAEPLRALCEFARVLKPGGRLVILEFDRPRLPLVREFYGLYSGWLMPRTATAISRDRSGAYRYLPKSVGKFMTREQMAAAIRATGLGSVRQHSLTFGVCLCHVGVKEVAQLGSEPDAAEAQ